MDYSIAFVYKVLNMNLRNYKVLGSEKVWNEWAGSTGVIPRRHRKLAWKYQSVVSRHMRLPMSLLKAGDALVTPLLWFMGDADCVPSVARLQAYPINKVLTYILWDCKYSHLLYFECITMKY